MAGGRDTNIIGDNGERNAAIRLTQGQLFYVIELGGKTPAFDLLCSINDLQKPYQFLVQVKATDSGDFFTKKPPVRIITPVPKTKYESLQKIPMPTYVVGVNNETEDVYIAPAFIVTNKYGGSIPTTYRLSKEDKEGSLEKLNLLKQDIIDYWEGLHIQAYKQSFNSSLT